MIYCDLTRKGEGAGTWHTRIYKPFKNDLLYFVAHDPHIICISSMRHNFLKEQEIFLVYVHVEVQEVCTSCAKFSRKVLFVVTPCVFLNYR